MHSTGNISCNDKVFHASNSQSRRWQKMKMNKAVSYFTSLNAKEINIPISCIIECCC